MSNIKVIGLTFAIVVVGLMLIQAFGKPRVNCFAMSWDRPYGHGEDNEPRDLPAIQARANQGYPAAQYRLAERYEQGKGVERNEAEAFKWYLRAAEQGETRAQIAVSWAYEHPPTCDLRDIELYPYPNRSENAYFWASVAVTETPTFAQHRDQIGKQWLTPAQMTDVKRRASEWKPKKN